MWKTEPSLTSNNSLEEIFFKLQRNPAVDGILLMGSAANKTAEEHSDYDLAFIVNNLPQNILGINTYIDNKFTEVFFYTQKEVKDLLAKEFIDPDKKEGWIINWSRDGKIIFDKTGLLAKVKEKSEQIKDEVNNTLAYSAWHKINYNFVQNMRYFHSGKELNLQALDIRLLYSSVEIFVGYFNVRKIPWRGEKLAIKYLKEHDANFLKLFQQFITETSREEKVKLYEKLVNVSLEPEGGIWDKNTTSVIPLVDFDESTISQGLLFWNGLLKESDLISKN